MSVRDVLVVGNLRGASRSALTTAVGSLKLNITETANVDEATAVLESQPWCAVLVDTTLSGASRFCAEARSNRTLFGIPFIALSPRLTDLAFLNALRWGADDVVALGAAEALTVRLASLVESPPATSTPRERGEAVVADPDRRRGNGLGRSIYTAGFAARYATDATSARFYATKPDVELFLLSAELTDPRAFIREAQAAGCQAKWVVLAKAAQTEELQKDLSELKGVVVLSAGGPPENVLFALNLLYPSEASRRGEIRALFGTVVYFRAVGDYRDECGFSYTASPQGLYVRTLAPPPADKVWVELIPPDGERRVRLVGKLAWSRPYGRQPGEPSPPGFGVRIVDGLGEDLALWSDCLKGLEFKAPATLVPEARFSAPAPARSSEPVLPISATSTSARRPAVPLSVGPRAVSTSRLGEAFTGRTDERGSDQEGARQSLAPSVPHPPISSMDRLSAAARARISTRPSLRLSLPSAPSVRREAVTKAGRLSRPPEASTELAAPETSVPKRVGQGRTVMGLGILQRDGSPVASPSSVDSPDRISTPPAEPSTTQSASWAPPNDPDRVSTHPTADASRLSPITGRTLSYGSQPPAADDHKFQAAAEVMPYPDDISDRPTLADRLSLDRAEQSARESWSPQGLTPAVPDAFDSLPPEALESDAPEAKLVSPPARLPGRATKTLLAEPVPSEAADTNRNWVGLEVIPKEQRLSEPPEHVLDDALDRDTPHSHQYLGATLPAMVVDTAPRLTPTAPHDSAASQHDGRQTTAVAKEAAGQSRPLQASPEADEPLELSGVPVRRSRSWLPLLAAVVVASGIIGILVKSSTHGPASEGEDVVAPPTPAAQPESAAAATAASSVLPMGGVSTRALETTTPAPLSSLAPTLETPPAASSAKEPDEPTPQALTESQPPKDPSSLPQKNALLFVQSTTPARVFVHGVDAGPTNSWLETPCGTRFVRLGRTAGDWLSPGMPVIIRCRSANTVEIPTL